jgi:tetratricopeptide (TPR) repeat protein
MRLAARSPATAPENTAFVLAIVANLLVYTGDPEAARDAYQEALRLVPGHAPSIAGLGRLAVGRGDLDEAVGHFQRATDILPLPEYVIALGETREAAGDAADARASYELARAQITLFEASGVGIDLELALFEADHGDAGRAVELARAAYAATPTTRAADALAWALYRAGRLDEARKRSAEALRLGSRDPLLRYHAGKIAAAAGDVASARRDLDLALRTDAGFSALGAADARQLLEELGP